MSSKKERGFLAGAIRVILGHTNKRSQLETKHKNERKTLAKENAAQHMQIRKEENQSYQAELEQISHLQKQEQKTLKQIFTRQSQSEEEGRSEETHRAADQAKRSVKNLRKQADIRRKKRRKRGERSRQNDLGRERD